MKQTFGMRLKGFCKQFPPMTSKACVTFCAKLVSPFHEARVSRNVYFAEVSVHVFLFP